jgi:D-aminoacyl-tRNA deacylase
MRAVAQRVSSASVEVEGAVVGRIERGLLVYLGAEQGDDSADREYMASKLAGLRVFEDEAGKMARSVADVGGSLLVVSQFTLFGDVRRGRRPSFDGAAPPADAERLYEGLVGDLRAMGLTVETGRFRAHMVVRAEVDGPVTILIDSRKLF